MGKKKKLLSVVMAVMMVLSICLPNLGRVKADPDPYPNIKEGVVLALADIDEDRKISYNGDNIVDGVYAGTLQCFMVNTVELAWVDPDTAHTADPNVYTFTFDEARNDFKRYNADGTLASRVFFFQEASNTVDGEEVPVDGVFQIKPIKCGRYYFNYEGDDFTGTDEQIRFYFDVVMPDVAAYSTPEEPSMENLLGDQPEYTADDREFYIQKLDNQDEGIVNVIQGYRFIYDDPGDEVSVEETGEDDTLGYKVNVKEGFADDFTMLVEYKSYIVDQDNQNPESKYVEINFFNSPKSGLIMAYLTWDDKGNPICDDKTILSGKENVRDVRMKNDTEVILIWNNDTLGPIVPINIPLTEINKFKFYDDDDNDITDSVEIVPATTWNEETHKEETVGDGFFRIKTNVTGHLHIRFNGTGSKYTVPEGEEDYYRNYEFNSIMPEVAAYTTSTATEDSLIGRRAEYTTFDREFYINSHDWDYGDGCSYEVSISDASVREDSAKDNVTLKKTTNGYKVTIKDGFNDRFNVDVTFTRTDCWEEEPIGPAAECWECIEFEPVPDPPRGLWMSWCGFDEDGKPYIDEKIEEAVLRGECINELSLKSDNWVSLFWVDDTIKEEAPIVLPIPLDEINNLKFYKVSGELLVPVTDVEIRPAAYWDEDEQKEVEAGDGIFVIVPAEGGDYVIKYEGENPDFVIPENPGPGKPYDEFAWTTKLPDVSIYSSVKPSEKTLLGRETNHNRKKKEFYINGVSEDHGDGRTCENKIIEWMIEPDAEEGYWDDKVTVTETNYGLKVNVINDFDGDFDIAVVYRHLGYEGDQPQPVEEWTANEWLNFRYEDLKPDPEVTAPTAKNLTYNEKDQQLVNAGKVKGGRMLYAIGKDSKNPPADEAFSTKIPTGKNVGVYYVWYKVIGDEDHCDLDPECVKVTIAVRTFIVQFDMNGHGTAIKPVKVKEGQMVKKPDDPEVKGYIFGGWFTDGACKKAYDFNAKVTKNLTLYAKWTAEVKTVDMFRLYNPNSGEHFYTGSTVERDTLIKAGWNYEGYAWSSPTTSNTPVYRVYNPNAGDHHFTMSKAEKDNLVAAGWNYEGIAWFSDDSKAKPLYRVYNPNAEAGSHHYTASIPERDSLIKAGWKDEGIAFYSK